MPGQPPKPPQRVPAAHAPAPRQHAPPDAESVESSSVSTKTILTIVFVLLAVVIGVPLLLCAGVMGAAYYRGRQAFEQIQAESAAQAQAEVEAIERDDIILRARLKDVFQSPAKQAIEQHWVMPEGVRRKRWVYGQVTKIDDGRFALHGELILSIRDAGSEEHDWSVEFTPEGPASADASWQVARVVVSGQQSFP